MILFPHCKINLGLHVLKRRTDGYHDIQSVMYPVPLRDILEITVADKTSLVYTGINPGCSPADDLCLKALESLKKLVSIPELQMHLHKNIPTGAGLGGGSSDAAFTIAGILKLINKTLPEGLLLQIIENIGSDCAFFLKGSPVLAEKKGEFLTPVPIRLSGITILIVKPAISVSTRDAYAWVKPRQRAIDLRILTCTSPAAWKDFLVNDFEAPVFERYPEIEQLKQKMYGLGAMYASMSGSGSAVFGLFSGRVNPGQTFGENFLWQGVLS